MTINRKILVSFLIMAIAFIGVQVFTVLQFTKANDKEREMIDRRVEILTYTNDLTISFYEQRKEVLTYLLLRKQNHLDNYMNARSHFYQTYTKVESIIQTKETKDIFQRMKNLELQYFDLVQQFVRVQNEEEKSFVFQKLSTKGNEFISLANEMITRQKQLLARDRQLVEQGMNNVRSFSFTLIFILSTGSLITIWMISNRITKPIRLVSTELQRVAERNLSSPPLHITAQDETKKMIESINNMKMHLKETMQTMKEISIQVASQAEQFAASAEQNTQSAEKATEMAEQTYAEAQKQLHMLTASDHALHELSIGMNQIAENSEDLLTSAERAYESVSKGKNAIQAVSTQANEVRAAMLATKTLVESLESRSETIGKITNVITAIAEQTNLLALNAAIEAARAGEHGKGFTVVADEVRKLSEQSKDAAKEIEMMLEKIKIETKKVSKAMEQNTQKLTDGAIYYEQTEHSFYAINESVEQVFSKIQTTSAAIEQMTAVSNELTQTMKQLKQLSQQVMQKSKESAVTVEEQLAMNEQISSAAQTLTKLSEQLRTMVESFHL